MAQSPPPAASRRQPRAGGNRPDPLAPMRTLRFWLVLALLFVANVVITNIVESASQGPTLTISYNSFLDQVNADKVTSITSTGEEISGTARNTSSASKGTKTTVLSTLR